MKPNQSRIVCRQAGAHESQNKTVKVATGKMEYNTRRFKREKSWKNYKLKQNKKIEYFDDAAVDAIMLDILDEYAPAFKALAKND